MGRLPFAVYLLLAAVTASSQTAKSAGTVAKSRSVQSSEDWRVWGGKNRDFIVSTAGLADSWPAAGPHKIWSRDLGDGYSAIAEDNGVLYTAYRHDSQEVIIALDAATGK